MSYIKLTSVSEVLKAIVDNDLESKSFEMELKLPDTGVDDNKEIIVDDNIGESYDNVVVENFISNNTFDVIISENSSENFFYVNDYKSIEDYCSFGEITVNETVRTLTLCNISGKTTCHLNLKVGNKLLEHVELVVLKTAEQPKIEISKKLLQ